MVFLVFFTEIYGILSLSRYLELVTLHLLQYLVLGIFLFFFVLVFLIHFFFFCSFFFLFF